MGFAWGAAGAAAAKALQEIQDRRRLEGLDRAREAREVEEVGLRRQALMAQLASNEAAEKRAARDQQLQEAGIAVQQADSMGQGAELSPDIASMLSGTPYGARVEQKSTLPSRSLSMSVDGAPATRGRPSVLSQIGSVQTAARSDPGGRQYSTLKPTQAQMVEARNRSVLDDTLARLTPDARNLATLEQNGIRGLNIHDVEGADAHQAHVAREQREAEERANRINRQAHEWAVARDDRTAARDDARGSRFTQADMADLMRDANTRAVAEYNAMANALDGDVPTDERGNPITPSMLAQSYIDETLAALDAFNESAVPSAPGGPRTVNLTEFRRRVTGQKGARPVVALTPRPSGPASGAGPGPAVGGAGTITRAELAATARRLGISEGEAQQQAAERGLRVR